MNKTNWALGVLAAMLLTACGGGGSAPAEAPVSSAPEKTPVSSAPAETPVSKFAPYLGEWAAPCVGYKRSFVTLIEAAGAKDTAITYIEKWEHYQHVGCNGAVVFTGTYSTNATASFTFSTDSSVVFTTGGAPIGTKVDHFSLSTPASRFTLSGSGVTHPVIDGQPKWCFADDRGPLCISDNIVAAMDTFTANLYVNANKLYWLMPNTTSGYDIFDTWTKK